MKVLTGPSSKLETLAVHAVVNSAALVALGVAGGSPVTTTKVRVTIVCYVLGMVANQSFGLRVWNGLVWMSLSADNGAAVGGASALTTDTVVVLRDMILPSQITRLGFVTAATPGGTAIISLYTT